MGRASTATRTSTRVLAALLGVSRNTVLAAYDELAAGGLIEARHGSGTRVPHDGHLVPTPFAPLRVLRDAQYPARTLAMLDPDGTSICLTYSVYRPGSIRNIAPLVSSVSTR